MREDIKINTKTGELIFKDNSVCKYCLFSWVNEDDIYVYGQINVSEYIDINCLYSDGICVNIPYTPIYKKIKIRIVKHNHSSSSPELNQADGSEWFEVNCQLYNCKEIQPKASELILINNSDYKINIIKNKVYLWSSKKSDVLYFEANEQNKQLMLMCVPGNNYRYPTSGVGLVRYLHSNLHQTDLASKLQSEFKDDKVKVKNASFNTNTGNLELDLDYTEANENI